jgi:hypothetical protein
MSNSGRRMKRLQAKRAASGHGLVRRRTAGAGLASMVAMGMLFAGSAQAANPPVKLGSDSSFSVLAGSTVTNTGPTTMFGDLGLDPGSSVTGAPHTLGAMHIDDGVAIKAKSDLVTGYNDAAGRPSTQLSSADLSGQSFTPGVYNASSSLLFSAGSVTLNAQGDPNAVFIFKVGSSMTTGSATTVLLTNGAQPCNVYWQIGASATLGTDSRFIGTVMALTTITAQTGMTMDGRLLARNGAVNLDTNTITTSACSTTTGTGGTGGTGGTTGGTGGTTGGTGGTTGGTGGTTTPTPVGSVNKTNKKKLAAQRRARRLAAQRRTERLAKERRARRLAKLRRAERLRLTRARAHRHHSPARPPSGPGGFTG